VGFPVSAAGRAIAQCMRILLVRPVSPNERFGLGPFFKVEPLGLEYIASALLRDGHDVSITDLRFAPKLEHQLKRLKPDLVGVSAMHTVDMTGALDVVRAVKRFSPAIKTVIGGHAAAAFPNPMLIDEVDALCVTDGEVALPNLVRVLDSGTALDTLTGFWLRRASGEFSSPLPAERQPIDPELPPARHLVADLQRHYRCVHKSPLWAIETTRGCPYRCNFCSVWRQQARKVRCAGLRTVVEDFANTGPNIFVVDDLFWYPPDFSRKLGEELRRQGIRKEWIVVQSRLDHVARHRDLLELWRPIAEKIDIFFGFEAASDAGLESLDKDMTLVTAEAGIRTARELDYGVTGNFVVDPDWSEQDFQQMWDMVERLSLTRAGYTVLTPLPGTPFYDAVKHRIQDHDWSHFDMHHLLWEPRLGRERFFELFAECWRRNVLSVSADKGRWLRWLRELSPSQVLMLVRGLFFVQRNMNAKAYLKECFPLQLPAAMADPTARTPAPPTDRSTL